jgi:hypothetical protein
MEHHSANGNHWWNLGLPDGDKGMVDVTGVNVLDRRVSRSSGPVDLSVVTGVLTEAGVGVTGTSLTLPAGLPLETWSDIGLRLVAVTESTAWWIGDWLVYGQDHHRGRYREAMSRTSLRYQTLRNYAWVARRCDVSRRRDTLSFQHHMEVAPLPPEDQGHWLFLAERHGWSRNELRRQIREASAPDDAAALPVHVSVSLTLPEDRVSRWEVAARRERQSLVEWMASVLDRAV